MSLPPIDQLFATMSFPKGWQLRRMTWEPDCSTISADYYPPTDHPAWAEGIVTGHGPTIEGALRDAQQRVWARWEKYEPLSKLPKLRRPKS